MYSIGIKLYNMYNKKINGENRRDEMALSEGITQELASRSKGLYTHQESSMYPTLYQLVKKEMISGRQKKVLKINKKKLPFFFSKKLIKNLKNHLFHSS